MDQCMSGKGKMMSKVARQWLSDDLRLLCFLWQRKPTAYGRQDQFNEELGNPGRKCHSVFKKARAWESLGPSNRTMISQICESPTKVQKKSW
ncbi:hypothetical protein XENORESO_007263 [Xenotaenia resolanae]|uniref:Uncharacterized protein n=1 Tax=Xenotaenia resolanae TaxID=208358 RepID=A0ABV0VVD0_9TELE